MKKILIINIALMFGLVLISAYSCIAQEICVIVNSENPVASLTISQVKLTYLRKINKRWKELNKNIVPVDRKGDTQIRNKFLKDVLQMTADELARYYTEREYQNAEAPPVKLTTDEEIIAFVENNVGAIAFVSRSSVKPGGKIKIALLL